MLEGIAASELRLEDDNEISCMEEEVRLSIAISVGILEPKPLAVVENGVAGVPAGNELWGVFDDKLKFPPEELRYLSLIGKAFGLLSRLPHSRPRTRRRQRYILQPLNPSTLVRELPRRRLR